MYQWDSTGKNQKWFLVGDSFWVMGVDSWSRPHSALGPPSVADPSRPCVCLHSPCKFICASVLRVLHTLVYLVFSTPLTLIIFLTPLPQKFSEPWEDEGIFSCNFFYYFVHLISEKINKSVNTKQQHFCLLELSLLLLKTECFKKQHDVHYIQWKQCDVQYIK